MVRDGRTVGVLVLGAADAERDLCPAGASVIERLWVSPDDVGEHIGTQLVKRACAPVSYTHLDVYKRQAEHASATLAFLLT